jgi:hypothetical protein
VLGVGRLARQARIAPVSIPAALYEINQRAGNLGREQAERAQLLERAQYIEHLVDVGGGGQARGGQLADEPARELASDIVTLAAERERAHRVIARRPGWLRVGCRHSKRAVRPTALVDERGGRG